MREVGLGGRGKQEEKNKPGTSERKAHFRYTGRPLAFGGQVRWNTMETWQKPEDVRGPNLPRTQSSGCHVLTRSDGGLRSHAGLPASASGASNSDSGTCWVRLGVHAGVCVLCLSVRLPGTGLHCTSALPAGSLALWPLVPLWGCRAEGGAPRASTATFQVSSPRRPSPLKPLPQSSVAMCK